MILASSMLKNMKIILSFISIYFAAALIFTVQAQSSKSIRKTATTTTDSSPRLALVIGIADYDSAPLMRNLISSLNKHFENE